MATQPDFKKLLRRDKILRDPIYGDFVLTALELEIVDTSLFQRLRRIRQLGCAHLVYPGAMHTRFSHSIGTLAATQEIIDRINSESSSTYKMEPHHIFLARLCALVHDLAHIPFGHTLEDEGNLFPSQWEDSERVQYYLGEDSEIGRILIHGAGTECLRDITGILVAKSESEILNLSFPFIADIVGDTLCADLLDYSERDTMSVGLPVGGLFDRRLLRYLFINRKDGPFFNRIALELSDDRGRPREDVLASLLGLLQMRYAIAERILFHRTKAAASAMTICAVYDSLRAGKLSKSNLLDVGDDELLFMLETSGTSTSKNLVAKLKGRQLYRPVYALQIRAEDYLDNARRRRRKVFQRFRDPEERWKLERKLESLFGLPEGSTLVYCPRLRRAVKSAGLKVMLGGRVMSLKDIPLSEVRDKIEAIERSYNDLPRFYVLVGADALDDVSGRDLGGLCKSAFEMPNDL